MWRISVNTGLDGVVSGELDSCNCFYLGRFWECSVMRYDAFHSFSFAWSIPRPFIVYLAFTRRCFLLFCCCQVHLGLWIKSIMILGLAVMSPLRCQV